MRSRSTDSSGFSSSPSPVRGRTDVTNTVSDNLMAASDIMEVEGLSRNVTEAHIQEIFGKLGIIRKVTFGRGWCQVQYETETEVEDACKYMNGGQLDGNLLECRPYKPQRRTLHSPRPERSHSRPLDSPRPGRSNSRPLDSPRPGRSNSRTLDSPRPGRSHSRPLDSPRPGRSNSRPLDSPRHSPRRDSRPSYSRSPPRRDQLSARSRSPYGRYGRRMYSPMRH